MTEKKLNEAEKNFAELDAYGKGVVSVVVALGNASMGIMVDILKQGGFPPPPDAAQWSVKALDTFFTETGMARWKVTKGKMAYGASLIHRSLIELFSRTDGPALKKNILAKFPADFRRNYSPSSDPFLTQRIFLALYGNDEELFKNLLQAVANTWFATSALDFLQDYLERTPFPPEWIASRNPLIHDYIVISKLQNLLWQGVSDIFTEPLIAYLRTLEEDKRQDKSLSLLLQYDLVAAHRTHVKKRLGLLSSADPLKPYSLDLLHGISGWIAFFDGHYGSALLHFRKNLSEFRKLVHKKKILPDHPYGLFHALSLLLCEDSEAKENELGTLLSLVKPESTSDYLGYKTVEALHLFREGLLDSALASLRSLEKIFFSYPEPLSRALFALGLSILDPDTAKKFRESFFQSFRTLFALMPLPAALFSEALVRTGSPPEEVLAYRKREEIAPLLRPFTSLLPTTSAWERAFSGIESFLEKEGKENGPEDTRTKRIAWLLDTDTGDFLPVEQTRSKKGEWKGIRPIALKRIYNQDSTLSWTDKDREIARTLRAQTYGYYNAVDYSFDDYTSLLALAGHPAVFDTYESAFPLELVRHVPELGIKESPEGYLITAPYPFETPCTLLEPDDSPGRYRVVDISKNFIELKRRIPKDGLFVPKEAKARIASLLQKRSPSFTLRADISGIDIPAIDASSAPVLQIEPQDPGLVVTFGVRPFGPSGPFYPTAKGGRLVTATIEGKTVHARRNPDAETEEANRLVNGLSLLSSRVPLGPSYLLDDPEECLEFLLELRENSLPKTLEWPKGETLKTTSSVSSKKLRLDIREAKDWFEIDGTIEVDETLVVGLKELLDGLSRARGRFVPLEDGRFVALTERLKAQMERLREVSDSGKTGARITPLGTLAIEELVSEAGAVKGDKKWKAFRERVRQAADYRPVLPSTLQAELRDYQVEGFEWMSRLAKWGAGACLADDMGLGKTVQAIAVMLELAPSGPVLVVAPTSVCHNWATEIERFAPSLNVHVLREVQDREARVETLRPLDVLITSYGLLAQEEDLFSKTKWQMAVFDEAQAFKNAETRRAQAARKIEADFRLALTGTPIENDLDELWSLFNTINPHLLGSRERFQSRFAAPIERQKDMRVLGSLRSLVRPFMLRRTKSMVLSELPPRTEVTIKVELPPDERAFYEALRQNALETLSKLSGPGGEKGAQRIHILAEITKLRRALCHPSLVDPGSLLPGAKLATFLDLSDELLRNRHKVLVFSQFTGQLEQVAKALDSRRISYQYLDGSTPPKEREKRVEAFQSGQGDLFLISLRAGGTGLNLTAADYVIHLDPWWNPAVEDQASDRAHRIGQQRPVTIYRLIATQSIEEKILDLHKRKRDLASDLLEGAEMTGKLTNEDLIGLIEGG